jgi:hypothetical protein
MKKKVINKNYVQLEIDFSIEEKHLISERTVIALSYRHEKLKIKHSSKTKIIHINEYFMLEKRNKEAEIINYIVNNSKSF